MNDHYEVQLEQAKLELQRYLLIPWGERTQEDYNRAFAISAGVLRTFIQRELQRGRDFIFYSDGQRLLGLERDRFTFSRVLGRLVEMDTQEGVDTAILWSAFVGYKDPKMMSRKLKKRVNLGEPGDDFFSCAEANDWAITSKRFFLNEQRAAGYRFLHLGGTRAQNG